MREDKNKNIYQADDRNFPLNAMRQNLVDNWLEEVPDFKGLLEYELSVLERVNKR
jgi:hypothetical protein